ncbi:MAG: hypothetical protein IT175_10230 [Acidobacteria bacterium]|nr:hypothetical protein [Acidobacteriota bacterium]
MIESAAPAVTLEFEGLTIRAHCGTRANREWLTEFLVPDFVESSSGSVDCTVRVALDDALYAEALGEGCPADAPLLDCFALDSSVVRLPILRRAGTETVVADLQFESIYRIDPDRRLVTIISHSDSIRVRASLLRVVREFAMNAMHGRGLFLHASSIAMGADGVAFAGRRSAGKTTLLTYLLGHGVGAYLSNDRVFVADRDPVPVLRNVPTVVSVRPGTLELCAGFGERLFGSGYATYLTTIVESDNAGPSEVRTNAFGNYFLSPAQFRSLFGAPQSTSATAAALVYPVIDDTTPAFRIEPLTIEELIARVQDALLGSGGWRKGPDALAIPVYRPSPSDEELAFRVRRFFERVRCFELRLGKRAFESTVLADAVKALATPNRLQD